MAIDLRRPAGRCRGWLESVLLSLEARGVLEATRERRPPHYHVAVYPKPYAAYVRQLTARAARGTGETRAADAVAVHVVRRGDSLDRIARLHGATTDALRRANGLTSSLIHPGQSLRVPRAQPSTARAARGTGETPAADAVTVHVVRRGDSLDRIARLYGATTDALRRANGLTSSLIHPGQSLRVPRAQPSTARAARGTGETAAADAVVVHVVRRGDSLDRIARLYGATIDALRRANGLTSSLIHPGQSLRVPRARP